MRIGIDARFATRPPRRGIGNYSLQLIAALAKLCPEHQFYLYISIPDHEGVLPSAPNVTVRRLGMPAYPLWEQVALPAAAREDRLDILHCLGNTGPLFMPKSVSLVLTIHDVMFLQTGEFVPKPTNRYQALGRHYRRLVAPGCARAADHVLTVSEFSRQDILQLIPGLDPARVQVTHQSCDPAFRQAQEQASREPAAAGTRPYIFTLGADDPRKNTVRLVRAYLSLLEQNAIGHDLVISGYANWEKSESYELVKRAGATDRVTFHSFITLEKLVELYRHAELFVYPSLYEGFGIPILEGFSSGCPVIASNVTSIPEVGGDAALYVDPLSVDEIRSALLRVAQDRELRESLTQRGYARAEKFSWEEVARKTLAVYSASISNPRTS